MESFEVHTFYRGFSSREALDAPIICSVRKGRRPRNTPGEIHEEADKWFLARFGIRYRSEAVFVTSSAMVANGYAKSERHIARVIPLGKYSYCWSPKIYDLLTVVLSGTAKDGIAAALDAGAYREGELSAAHAAKHEVMLACETYVAIPIHLLETPSSKPATPGTILVP